MSGELADVPLHELRAEVERRERAESFVAVICQGGCHAGGVFPDPPDYGPPVDDDGRDMVVVDGEWWCARCAE